MWFCVCVTPARIPPSPRWQTGVSLWAAPGFCRAAGPNDWSWEDRQVSLMIVSMGESQVRANLSYGGRYPDAARQRGAPSLLIDCFTVPFSTQWQLTMCGFLEAKFPSPPCQCRTSGDRYFLSGWRQKKSYRVIWKRQYLRDGNSFQTATVCVPMSSLKPPTGSRQVPVTNWSRRILFSLSISLTTCSQGGEKAALPSIHS